MKKKQIANARSEWERENWFPRIIRTFFFNYGHKKNCFSNKIVYAFTFVCMLYTPMSDYSSSVLLDASKRIIYHKKREEQKKTKEISVYIRRAGSKN